MDLMKDMFMNFHHFSKFFHSLKMGSGQTLEKLINPDKGSTNRRHDSRIELQNILQILHIQQLIETFLSKKYFSNYLTNDIFTFFQPSNNI